MLNKVVSDTEIVSVHHMVSPVLIVENHAGTIRVNGETVHLTAQEKSLLLYLVDGKGQVRTKTMLLSHLAQGKNIDYKLVDVLICKIRSKLKRINPQAADTIRSIWGRGYAWGHIETNPPAVWNPYIPNTTRWTIARKAALIEALQLYQVETATVQTHYPDLSTDELLEWNRGYRAKGQCGLMSTRPNAMSYQLAA